MPPTSSIAAASLLSCFCDPTVAAVVARQHLFLAQGAKMQPDVVARTLVKVEDEWAAQAKSFAHCDTTAEDDECSLSQEEFLESCSTVVTAVLQASSGDRSVVAEYMKDVCGASSLADSGWKQQSCWSLAQQVEDTMSEDSYINRESLDARKMCAGVWTGFAADAQAQAATERAAREAAEKKVEEERKRRRQEEEEEEEAAREAAQKKAEVEEEAAAAAAVAKKQRNAAPPSSVNASNGTVADAGAVENKAESEDSPTASSATPAADTIAATAVSDATDLASPHSKVKGSGSVEASEAAGAAKAS